MHNYIQESYHKNMKSLVAQHGGIQAAITPQEQMQAKNAAIRKGQEYFAQQQALVRQQQGQVQMAARMQALGQIPPGMNGQMNAMGAHIGGQQMNEQQRQAMMQMAQMPHVGGAGVQNVNGGLHPHMNGGGMGGIQ